MRYKKLPGPDLDYYETLLAKQRRKIKQCVRGKEK